MPVTVCVPLRLSAGKASLDLGTMSFQPGQLHRNNVAVPVGATWVDFHLRAGQAWGGGDGGQNKRLTLLHAQQLVPQTAHRDSHKEAYLWMNAGTEKVLSMRVTPGRTMELVIGP